MKVTFLGTGTSTGIPMVGCHCAVCDSDDPRDNRTRCSVFVEVDGKKLVVDTGPDLRRQLLREGIEDMDAVLFTHSHKDHIAGLDDIRPINYLKNKHIDVHASSFTIHRLKQEYPYIFDGSYPGVPLINLMEIDTDPFEACTIPVIPIPAKHGSMDVLGFRIGNFTYMTDVNFIESEAVDLIRGSEVFVINALQRTGHYSHFTLSEALELIEKVDAPRSYLTHMSHRIGKHEEVEKELPKGVHMCYDGLKITV